MGLFLGVPPGVSFVSGVDYSFKFGSVAVLEKNFCYFVFSVGLSNKSVVLNFKCTNTGVLAGGYLWWGFVYLLWGRQ